MKTLIKELVKIQKELKAPKNQFNSFSGFNYRNAEDIQEAIKPLLPEGITLYLTDEIVMLGDRFYNKSTAIFTDGENKISVDGYAREALTKKGMDEAQITGSASSYARKYALNGMFLIDDSKDADSQDNREEKEVKKQPTKILETLESLTKKADLIEDVDELRKFYAKHTGFGKEFEDYIIKRAEVLKKK